MLEMREIYQVKDVRIQLTLTIRKVIGTIWYLVVLGDLARYSHGPAFVLRFSEQGKESMAPVQPVH